MLKRTRVALFGLALGVAALAAGRPAEAAFQFNPTGGGSSGALTITGFQPGVNSALAQGGITAINSVGVGGTGSDTAADQFVLKYQTAINGFLPSNVTAPGLNSSYQITATVEIREYVTSVSADGKTFTFAVSANQSGLSGLQLFYNPTVTYDATGLNGASYKPAGATQILQATATSSSQNSFTNQPTVGNLDQSQYGNAWGAQQTVYGTGGSIVTFTTSTVNNGFFPSGVPSVLQLRFTGSQNTPFLTNHPAQTMFDGTATAPLIGSTNGSPGGGGTSVLFEVNGSLSAQAVPEPTSIALTALGLVGSLVVVRRKRTATA